MAYCDTISSIDILMHQDTLAGALHPGFDSLYTSSVSLSNRAEETGNKGELLPFSLAQTDGILILFLFCFFIFSHIYSGGISFLKENSSLIFSPSKSSRLGKLTTAREMISSYFLVFQAIALISISLYQVFMDYTQVDENYASAFVTILSFILLLASFLFLKVQIYKMVGYIFDLKEEVSARIRSNIVAFEILGILYFIPTLLLIYSDYFHLPAIIMMAGLFLIIEIIFIYRLSVFFISKKFNFLYLIAYLCSVEILPYIFLTIGLVYLYRYDVFNLL